MVYALLFLATVLVSNANALVDKEQAAKLSCYLINSWTIFDLRTLQNSTADYTYGNLTWNFCHYTQWPYGQLIKKADTFAQIYNETSN
jgi:phage pi2 protein 07